MNKEQNSQLVQDVIDGKESYSNARLLLFEQQEYISKCLDEIIKHESKEIRNRIKNGDNKNIHQ